MSNLRIWIGDYLGIVRLAEMQITLREGQHRTDIKLNEFSQELREAVQQLHVTNAALAAIIAKLDPMSGLPEDNPIKRQVSDELNKAVLARLDAEQAVLEHYGYKP